MVLKRPVPIGQQPSVVTIVYKSLPLYRIPFFEGLRQYLGDRGVELRLIYGQPPAEESKRRDTGEISWGQTVDNHIITIGNRFLCWQPCLHLLKDSNLVIVEQASKMVNNYILAIKQMFGGPRIAFWGHGRCFMEHAATRIGEVAKKSMSRRAHWWFAYNDLSAHIIRDLGFPEERITVVQNAIDTTTLMKRKSCIDRKELSTFRDDLKLKGENVGIYAGGLYTEKRIDFLLQAAFEVRRRVPDFELLVLGAGPLQDVVERAAREAEWIHYLGPRFNEEKVPFFMLSKVMLIPGAVGLAVIDSFALEVPLVTVDLADHGPEIEYLKHNENGLILKRETTPEEYAGVVTSMMLDVSFHKRLIDGCRVSAKTYTLEAMTENFAVGVLKALSA